MTHPKDDFEHRGNPPGNGLIVSPGNSKHSQGTLENFFSSYDSSDNAAIIPPDPDESEPTTRHDQPIEAHDTVADLSADAEWLREERIRLETYTLNQFAEITKQREELAVRKSSVEAHFALREQELNRQMKILAERTDALQQRESKMMKQEAQWAVLEEERASAEQYCLELQQTSVKLKSGIEQQRLLLQSLRLQTNQVQEQARVAQSELVAFQHSLENKKRNWHEQETRLAVRQEQLELRFKETEKKEQTIRKRESELDELAAEVRADIEQREQELAVQNQELQELQTRLRKDTHCSLEASLDTVANADLLTSRMPEIHHKKKNDSSHRGVPTR